MEHGLKILDCAHGFVDMTIVVAPDNRWLLCHAWTITCWDCHKPGTVVYVHPIDRCPFCDHRRGSEKLPLRNYVIGQNQALDERLRAIGLLPALPKERKPQ